MISIESPQNQLIKKVKKLHYSKHRQIANQFIAEGLRTISTLVENNAKLEYLFVTEHTQEITSFYEDVECVLVPESIMASISTNKTPSGVFGVFAMPKRPQVSTLTSGAVLAQVSDPGNMGTLIRTTAAMGLNSVVCIEGVDPWHPKVVQSSAGAIAAVNIFLMDWQTLIDNKGDIKLAALVVEEGAEPTTIDKNSLIVIGNEANGLPRNWSATCNQQITLPMPGHTESLNAAVAGSIALYLLAN